MQTTAPDRYVAPVSWLSGLAERAQGTIAGGISRLPAPVLRLLAGSRPVRVDGLELDADVQLGLRMLSLGGKRALDQLGPARAREEMARNARIFAGSNPRASTHVVTVSSGSTNSSSSTESTPKKSVPDAFMAVSARSMTLRGKAFS